MSDTNDADLPQLPWAIRWALTGVIRHAATSVGGALLTLGALPNQQSETKFETWFLGVVLTVGGLAWSAMNHKAQQAKIATSQQS